MEAMEAISVLIGTFVRDIKDLATAKSLQSCRSAGKGAKH